MICQATTNKKRGGNVEKNIEEYKKIENHILAESFKRDSIDVDKIERLSKQLDEMKNNNI